MLTLIFGIYLLSLPAIACADKDVCGEDQKNNISQTDRHSDHEEKPEDCGSFCTCSCCVHIVSVNYQSPEINLVKPSVTNQPGFFYNNISLPSNYFGNIWQPPKIS
jgi:hypothetical protein